jgi:hypothetical protein
MTPIMYKSRSLYIITARDEDEERRFVEVTTNYKDAEDTLTAWGAPFSAEIATVELDRKSFKFSTVSEFLKGNYN